MESRHAGRGGDVSGGVVSQVGSSLATGTEEGSGALATAQLRSWEGGWCLPLQSDFSGSGLFGRDGFAGQGHSKKGTGAP